MREYEDRERTFKKIAKGINEETQRVLKEMGFLSAPASTKFHGAYPGGLFDHSELVTRILRDYTDKLGLIWSRKDSPERIAILHDICKIDQYKEIKSDCGDIQYEYDKSIMLTGHGDKSTIVALRLVPDLTDEELMCIRYHMGPYEGKEMWNNYKAVIKKYPNILYVHTADMMASNYFEM